MAADDSKMDYKEEKDSAVDYDVEEEIRLIWSNSPGLSVNELCQQLARRHGGNAPPRERIKQAREAIPYRRVSSLGETSTVDEKDPIEESITQLLEQRGNYRSTKRVQLIKLADRIAQGLGELGVQIDDQKRTWMLEQTLSEEMKAKINALQKQNPGVRCDFCGRLFGSRNLVFDHLRNPDSGCGASIAASGQSLVLPPSSTKSSTNNKAQTNIQVVHRRFTGATTRHANLDSSLWIGNIPLPWTKPQKGKYRKFKALLYAYSPRGVAQPWIKTVVRKAYHDKVTGKYMGFAIVVYRDAQEAALVRQALDAKELNIHNVYSAKQLQSDHYAALLHVAPKIVLSLRPAKKSDVSDVAQQDTPFDVPPGSDPPLAEQLKPLTTDELCCRIERLQAKFHIEKDTKEEVQKQESDQNMTHQQALDKLVQLYGHCDTARREQRLQGRAIPTALQKRFIEILETLRWPAVNQRAGLSAERYLVLTTSAAAKDTFYQELRQACDDLMQWADPEYYFSGIAVTKNFVASPHIDDRDQSFQYAVSLGSFTDGGELCVEGVDDKGDEVLNVIDTRNRIARADGRHLHWVRTWSGGDRYSLIFYDTSDRCPTKLLESGVDLEYLTSH